MKDEIKFYTIKHKNSDKTRVVSVEEWLQISARSQGNKIVSRHATDPRTTKEEMPVARPMAKPKEDKLPEA